MTGFASLSIIFYAGGWGKLFCFPECFSLHLFMVLLSLDPLMRESLPGLPGFSLFLYRFAFHSFLGWDSKPDKV